MLVASSSSRVASPRPLASRSTSRSSRRMRSPSMPSKPLLVVGERQRHRRLALSQIPGRGERLRIGPLIRFDFEGRAELEDGGRLRIRAREQPPIRVSQEVEVLHYDRAACRRGMALGYARHRRLERGAWHRTRTQGGRARSGSVAPGQAPRRAEHRLDTGLAHEWVFVEFLLASVPRGLAFATMARPAMVRRSAPTASALAARSKPTAATPAVRPTRRLTGT